jgi:hypothetical protein
MLHLRTVILLALPFALACSSSSGSPAGSSNPDSGSPGGPSRKTVSCSDVQTEESAMPNATFNPGSWGNVPATMQQVPPGGTLCGSTVVAVDGGKAQVITHIVSTLWDQDLYNFYLPLVMNLGCTLKPMDTSASTYATYSRTSFTCTNMALGTISANEETQYFLTYNAP